VAFDVDALANTRPVEYPVSSPQDAEDMFDLITYQKGSAVLRMLEQYLGEERFREGTRHYLATHQYGNTETNDLWEAIEHVTGEPVRRIMDSWIFQRGFPLISVAGGAASTLMIRQKRFCLTPAEGGDDIVWSVPVVLRYACGGQVVERWELLESASVAVDLDTQVDWVVVNAGGQGFYRVRYAPNLLHKLIPIMMQQLAPIERYGLVDDAWASVVSGSMSTVDFLEFAKKCQDETDLDVWTVLSRCLEQMERLIEDEACERYHDILRSLYRPVLARLRWEPQQGDSSRTLELRGHFIRALTVLGKDTDALARSRELHNQYLQDRSSVEPNIAFAVAAAVASVGTGDDYNMFVKRFKHASTPQEERRYQMLLALFPGENEMVATLEMTLNGEVRVQDAPYLVAQCLRNRDNGMQAWRFVRDNWDKMLQAYSDDAIVRMLDGLKSLSYPDIAAEIKKFFQSHTIPQGNLILQQHLEKLQINVALREREADRLAVALLD
jgi:puromycin-sensitive aminopeptidase